VISRLLVFIFSAAAARAAWRPLPEPVFQQLMAQIVAMGQVGPALIRQL